MLKLNHLVFCLVSLLVVDTCCLAQPFIGTTDFTTSSTTVLKAVGLCTSPQNVSYQGYNFTLSSGENCALNHSFGGASGSTGHINLITTPTVTGIWLYAIIGSDDGSEFKLENFNFNTITTPWVGRTITVTGYKNGVFVPGATYVTGVISAINVVYNVDVTSNSAFNDIDQIYLTPDGGSAQGTFQLFDITIANAIPTVPEIDMKGNSTSIVDGDATPNSTDHTDFGSQSICSGTIVRTFTIENTGTANLTLSNPTLSGTNAADFSITSSPTSPVTASGSTTFQVTFNPSASGTRTATVTVSNNDSNEGTYDFAIQGTGIDPEVNVQGNGNSIADGDATPSATDHTDFGSQNMCSGTIVRTFTIQNTGNSNLTLANPTLSGTNAADFSVTVNPSTPVSAAGSTTFQVTFDPSASGTRSATVSFTSDDCDEATYDFAIQGTGIDDQSTFYLDSDTDTYGDAGNSTQACSVPGGYVIDNTDCNDSDMAVHSAPVITSQPSNASNICDLYNTSFSVAANFATGYQWEVSTDGGGLWNNATGGIYSGETSATLSLTGVTQGHDDNQYRCVITGGCLPNATTNHVSLTVQTPVTIPTNLSTSGIELTQATFSWDNVANATDIRVSLTKQGNTFSWFKNDVYADSYTYLSSASFTENSDYDWKVKIKNTAGCWGDWSAVESYYVCSRAAPTTAAATNIYSNKTTLNWTHTGADEMRIALRKVGNPYWIYKNEPYASSYEWNANFTKNASYEWMIKVRCGTIWSDWSDVGTFTSGTVAGMKVQEESNGFDVNTPFEFAEVRIEVYPNPSDGNFTISSTHEGKFNIINELGQLIEKIEFTEENSFLTRVEGLQRGVYFVMGMSNGSVIRNKIVIQ